VLWSPRGANALDWLRGRGLSDETIRSAALGYNSTGRWDTWGTWGLEPREGKRGVWLPRGVVIPWTVGDNLWKLHIRRPRGKPKYVNPAGSGNPLYNADALTVDKPAILVEGVLDVLTIKQVADDLVTPVATGSTSGARRVRWIARLALCPLVLIAFDSDEAGCNAADYWLTLLDNAKRWRPLWEDANAMLQDSADVRAWVAAGVSDVTRQPTNIPLPTPEVDATSADAPKSGYPITLVWPADLQGVGVVEGQWRRLETGEIEATYPDRETLAYAIAPAPSECDSCPEWALEVAGALKRWPDDPPRMKVCRPFGTGEHRRFWRRPDAQAGGWVCASCHPPRPDVEVEFWTIPE
jgi:5S rRNA maturation endonuclease (ribonuclease M5)